MNATAEQTMTEAEREAKFQAQVVTAQGETIADMHRYFNLVCDTKNWKAPINCRVHHSVFPAILRAIEFMHADKAELVGISPITGYVIIHGHGYQAD